MQRNDRTSQSWLIDRMKALGYFSDINIEGVCFGYAHVAMTCALANCLDPFFNFASELYTSTKKFDEEKIDAKSRENLKRLEELLELRSGGSDKNIEEEIKTIEMALAKSGNAKTYFEWIALYQSIPTFQNIFDNTKLPSFQDAKTSAYFVEPEILKLQGGIKKNKTFGGVYTKEKLIAYAEILQKYFSPELYKERGVEISGVPFVLGGSDHAICIIFTGDHWVLMNANQPPKITHSAHVVANYILRGFFDPNRAAFCTHLNSTQDLEDILNKQYQKLLQDKDFKRNQQLSEIDLKYRDPSDNSALYTFVISDAVDQVADYAENCTPDELNSKNKKGDAPIHIAMMKNNAEIANILLNKGADINLKSNEGLTPLHYAIKYNAAEAFEILVGDSSLDIHSPTGNDISPLSYAVGLNRVDFIETLMALGADVNHQNQIGLAPLHYAVIDNAMDALEILLEDLDIDVNIANEDGLTPLDLAIAFDKPEFVKNLMMKEAKAGPEFESIIQAAIASDAVSSLAYFNNENFEFEKYLEDQGDDYDAIKDAIEKNSVKCAEYLLNNVDKDYFIEDYNCDELLNLAVKKNAIGTLKILLTYYESIPDAEYDLKNLYKLAQKLNQDECKNIIREHYNKINNKNTNSSQSAPVTSPKNEAEQARLNQRFHEAIKSGNIKIIENIIKEGANISSSDKDGYSAITNAIWYGHPKVVKYLQSFGATLDTKDLTIFSKAVQSGNHHMVDFLNDQGIKFPTNDITLFNVAIASGNLKLVKRVVDLDCATPPEINYHTVIQKDQIDLFRYLVKEDIILQENRSKISDHLLAAEFNSTQTLEYLIGHGVDIDKQNEESQTALHIAVNAGSEDAVDILLQNNCEINISDNDGNTALHLACKNHDIFTLEKLLDYGADWTIKNRDGYTALDICKQLGIANMINLFDAYKNNHSTQPNYQSDKNISSSKFTFFNKPVNVDNSDVKNTFTHKK